MEIEKSKTTRQIIISVISICSLLCPLAKAEDVSDYITDIYIYQVWDYNDPTDNEDLIYEFNLEIDAVRDKAINMDADVNNIEFLTPAGHTFQIPKQPDLWSDDTWTSYEYTPDEGQEKARWKYKVKVANEVDLQVYIYNNVALKLWR
jgi:hypothetical protein